MSKDNVWAFPKGQSDYSENRGMTLRDYFAAKALSGILADRANIDRFDAIGSKELVEPAALMATAAYQMADAMLKERAK